MKPSKQLRALRAKIDAPEKWCKGALARNLAGEIIFYANKDACKFCIYGAAGVIGLSDRDGELALNFVRRVIDIEGVSFWQDAPKRTHAEVMEALDKAIALAEGERK